MIFVLAAVLAFLPTQAVPPASTTTSLTFLAHQAGKRPSEAGIFQNPVMKQRLASLLKADAVLVPVRFETENPIQASGAFVAMFGNKAHGGGFDDALLVVNAKTDELWVWLRVDGKLRRFGPAADPTPLPEDAMVRLNEMTGRR